MTSDHEVWGYDEPHESGGNTHTTMTRRQAIDWMKDVYKFKCSYLPNDTAIFYDWVACHWAYKVSPIFEPNNEPDLEPYSRDGSEVPPAETPET
jgi:hypothetical protein